MSPVNTGKLVRRGVLTSGICLGVCCLAVLAGGPVLASPLKPAAQESTAAEGQVFLDEIIKARSTRRSGFAPYRSTVATIGGEVFRRSLITEVGGVKPSDTLSVVTLKIDGKYERFQATVGRSDEEARNGPAYAYFEVWGDGTCFFRSTAIRSANNMVTVPSGATVRKTPQTINITVRGTKTLQLVTRYASTIDQQAPDVTRANGCVWGDPRLLTAVASTAPVTNNPPDEPAQPSNPVAPTLPKTQQPPKSVATAPVPQKAPVKAPIKASPPSKAVPVSVDPRRDSVRMAVLLLASGVGSTLSADPGQPPLSLRYPLKIALLPLRPSTKAAGDRRRGSATGDMQSNDPQLQNLLETSLPTARRGREALFTLLDQDSATQMARLLTPSLMTAIIEPTSADILPLAAFCRAKQVDAVLVPTLMPGTGTASRGGSRLDLRLYDAATGTLLAQSLQVISLGNRN
ncbi:MAG: NPCBM/NEW2 domain-containing protein [Armatimonadota bacterium]